MRKLSYNPLWKKLIDLKMSKSELAEKAGISRSTIAKMRKDEAVSLDLIEKIAIASDCDVVDILSILPSQIVLLNAVAKASQSAFVTLPVNPFKVPDSFITAIEVSAVAAFTAS